MQKNRVTVYLLKDTLLELGSEPVLSIKVDEPFVLRYLKLNLKDWCQQKIGLFNFYYIPSFVKEPEWLKTFFKAKFLNDHNEINRLIANILQKHHVNDKEQVLENKLIEALEKFLLTKHIFSSIAKAILVVPVEDRFFLISFGYATKNIELPIIERKFGLKLALRMVNENEIHQVEGKELKSKPRNFFDQFVSGGNFGNFNFNPDSDIVKYICGKSSDIFNNELNFGEKGIQISGRDCISFKDNIDVDSISEKLLKLLKIYNTELPEYCKFIENISEVDDKQLIELLNTKLAEVIYNNKDEYDNLNIEVSYSRVMHPESIDKIVFNGKRYDIFEISVSDILAVICADVSSPCDVLNNLLKKTITFKSHEDVKPQNKCSVYRCIISETTLDGKSFIFDNGLWYEVDDSFYKILDAYFQSLVKNGIEYNALDVPFDPMIDKVHQINKKSNKSEVKISEGKFNERLCQNNAEFLLMDKKLVNLHNSSIEACDIYHDQRKSFIHIKRYCSSAGLSHLFHQGINSYSLFVQDIKFINLLTERFTSVKWKSVQKDVDSNIVYGIIKKGDKDIPLFSKITLYTLRDTFLKLRVTPVIKFIDIKTSK